tara:strand:- start:10734 stop:11576 length:843 start_codon:yes stop_codon:yes gene_type:complete
VNHEIFVDLHLHTTFSDGVLNPKDLVNLCYKNGLKYISITDHDCIDGIQESIDVSKSIGKIDVIPGIELSTQNEMHILGYYIDYEDLGLKKILANFQDDRIIRTKETINLLSQLGIDIDWNVVKSFAGEGAIGRPHIAKAMIAGGFVKSFKDAFDIYLGKSGLAYVGKVRMTPKEAIELIHSLGGVSVLAHPTFCMPGTDDSSIKIFEKTLIELKSYGLKGLEVYYKNYSADQISMLKRLALSNGLICAGGSDFHGNGEPDEVLPGLVGPPMRDFSLLRN